MFLSENLTKLVKKNLKVSSDIIDSINDTTTKQELASIKTEIWI